MQVAISRHLRTATQRGQHRRGSRGDDSNRDRDRRHGNACSVRSSAAGVSRGSIRDARPSRREERTAYKNIGMAQDELTCRDPEAIRQTGRRDKMRSGDHVDLFRRAIGISHGLDVA